MSMKRKASTTAKKLGKKRKSSDDTESLSDDGEGVLLSDNPVDFVTESTPGKTKIKSLLSTKGVTTVEGLLNIPRGVMDTMTQFGPKAVTSVDDFVRKVLGFTDKKLKEVGLEHPPLLVQSEEIPVVDPSISASDLLAKDVRDFAFTTQTKNKLMEDKLNTVEQILKYTPKEFGNLHKVGKISLKVFEDIYRVAIKNGALEMIGVQPAVLPAEKVRREKAIEKIIEQPVEKTTADNPSVEPCKDSSSDLNEILKTKISLCNSLTPNKLKSLHDNGITTVRELLQHPPSALTKFNKIGIQTVDLLKSWLVSGLGLPASSDLSHLDLWNDDLVEALGEHVIAPFFVDEVTIKLAKRKVSEKERPTNAKQLDDTQRRAEAIRKDMKPNLDKEQLAKLMQNDKAKNKKKRSNKTAQEFNAFTPHTLIDSGILLKIPPQFKVLPRSKLTQHSVPSVVIRRNTKNNCKSLGDVVRVRHPQGGDLCVANTGGRTACGDWCPTSDGSIQYLAAAIQSCDDVGDPTALMGSTSYIQVWGLEIDTQELSLAYACLLPDTPIWDVKFCPSARPDDGSIGLLAVSLGNGRVNILNMPSPATISTQKHPKRSNGAPLLDIPAYCSVQMKGDNCTSMKLSWSRMAEGEGSPFLAVGMMDGSVGILRFCPRTDKLVIVDRLQYGNSPCTGVSWSPQSPFLMASCYHGDPVMVWDVRNTRVPLFSHMPPMYWCSDIQWASEAAFLLSGSEKSIWVTPAGGDMRGGGFSDENVDSIMGADVLLKKQDSVAFCGGNDGVVYRNTIFGQKNTQQVFKAVMENGIVYIEVPVTPHEGERDAKCRLQENPGSITFVRAQNLANNGRFVMCGSANTLNIWIDGRKDEN